MSRWVAFLRGVNVGGHRRVPMADLRAGLESRGLAGARTYLQSGNAVFDGGPDDQAAVSALVRSVVLSSCGVDTDVVVRSSHEVAGLVQRLPWPERADQPTLLQVLLLAEVPDRVEVVRIGPQEDVFVDGREVWLWYGAGAGRSKLSLDIPGAVLTARNWRTMLALDDLCRS